MDNSQGPKDYKTLKKDGFIKDVNHPLVTKNYTMVTANQYALDSNKACCGYDVFDVKTNESIAYSCAVKVLFAALLISSCVVNLTWMESQRFMIASSSESCIANINLHISI